MVAEVTGIPESTSASPYDRFRMALPFLTTTTLAPGMPGASNATNRESMASTALAEREAGLLHAVSATDRTTHATSPLTEETQKVIGRYSFEVGKVAGLAIMRSRCPHRVSRRRPRRRTKCHLEGVRGLARFLH